MSGWLIDPVEPVLQNKEISEAEALYTFYLPSTLYQFQGHFVDFPLLPGVAQLDWAVRCTAEAFSGLSAVGQITRLKFRGMIRPDSTIYLRLSLKQDKAQVQFSYSCNDEICASGVLHMGGV